MLNDDFGILAKDEEDKDGKSGNLAMRLLKTRTIMICRPIDRALMDRVCTALQFLESEDASATITVVVNSPGGDADSGFAMYDMLRFVKPKVRSICAGLAASAAVPVFLGADDGERFTLPNSRFLLHQPSMQAMGQASDVEITANEIVKIRDKYNLIIEQHTGKPAKQVEEDCNRDFWLSAQESVEYGLSSKIIAQRGEIE